MNICLRKYLFVALHLTLLAGCNDAGETLPLEENMPVVFSMEFGSKTRSTLDNVWPDNTQIAISKGSGNTLSYYTPANASSANSGQAITLTASGSNMLSWPSSDPHWVFSAWYPYSVTAPTGITVANDQGAIDDDTYYGYDIMYSPAVSDIYQATVPLKFYHQMSRVMVVVITDNTPNKESVTSVTFGEGTKDISVSGTFTMGVTGGVAGTAASWTPTTASNSYITMRKTSTSTEEDSHIFRYECMLPPQSGGSSDDILLTIMTTGYIDENDETQTPQARKYVYKAAYDLQAGYQTNYFITCKDGSVIIIITSSVAGWNSTIQNIGGNATVPDNRYN